MNTEDFKRELLPHHRLLYSIAYRLTEDTAIAEDLVQDAYAKLWSKRVELSDVKNYRAFAITVLRNICFDYLRIKRERVSIDDSLENTDLLAVYSDIELRDEVGHVKLLINKLPEQQRRVMILKHWDNYSDDEIEQITGLSKINIRVILSRARKTVKDQFKTLR